MLELPHTIVGAAIALKVGNPALAIPLALASHFIGDLVPHWNPHLNSEIKEKGRISKRTTLFVAVDTMASLVSGFVIASRVLPDTTYFVTILATSFAAVAPDVVEAPYFFFGIKSKLIDKLLKFQKSIQNDKYPPIVGVICQVLVIGTAIWWITH